jgi:hypothetical protein
MDINKACIFDPQPGDFVRKGSKTRTVIDREGGEVQYETQTGKIKTCWISTWMEWCNKDLDEAIAAAKSD